MNLFKFFTYLNTIAKNRNALGIKISMNSTYFNLIFIHLYAYDNLNTGLTNRKIT